MDFDVRLKALSRLAQSKTDAADAALRKELDKVIAALHTDTQYDVLIQHLEVLDTIGHRFSASATPAILRFIAEIESRTVTYSIQEDGILHEIEKYHNTSTLIGRAVEVLKGLRYLESKSILHALLELSRHSSDNVRTEAIDALKSLASYDITVFYGKDKQPGIGPLPQKIVIDELEHLRNEDLEQHFLAILVLIDELLSPMIHGTSWSHSTITISQRSTPALPTVEDIRRRSIELLKRMYRVSTSIPMRLQVIRVLNGATRTYGMGEANELTARMIVRDSLDVLSFYGTLVRGEDLQVVQSIENSSYWIFYHAIRPEIEAAAREIEQQIRQHSEYEIYKTLIGFEGKFDDWSRLKADESAEEDVDNFRKRKALSYAESITPNSYKEWRRRILKYAQTQSNDLASFPIFCYFLEAFASAQPQLALQLASTASEQIEGFLIPLLRSLWLGAERSATRSLIISWVEQGRYLWQSTRLFLANERIDRDILALLLRKAQELENLDALAALISVAVSNYSKQKQWLIDELFLPALEVMTQHLDTRWIDDFWVRRESRVVMRELTAEAIELILRNLLALKRIEYQAEEVLYLIAITSPDKVLRFLCQRLVADSKEGKELAIPFDAIPFRLHKLNAPLSKIPREAIRLAREQFDRDPDRSMFMFRGARLLKTIFPDFPPEFEAELLNMVESGGDENYDFVLAVLRNYDGESFINKICKQIIRLLPADSLLRTEVAVAMLSTGVVVGEFGMAEAYERKRDEVADWLNDPDEKVQDFARSYMSQLEAMSSVERKRAEEEITLRKYRYGEK